MAARASHRGAGDATGLYLVLGDEAEVPDPLAGGDAPRNGPQHHTPKELLSLE